MDVSLETRFQDQASFRDLVDLLSAEAGLNYVGNLHHCVAAGVVRYLDALFVRNDDRE